MNYKFMKKNAALDEELRALYEEGGKLPDMKHLNHKRQRRITRALLGLVIFFAVLTAASWAGFFLFGSQSGGEGDVKLEIEGQRAVMAGIPQEVKVRFRNLDRQPLAFTGLRLRIPAQLYVAEVSPKPTTEGRLEWEFGSVPANHTDEILLTVIPYGKIGETIDLTAVFSYKPANFNAEFQVPKVHTFEIQESPFTIELQGPREATAGQRLQFNATITNQSDRIFERVRARLQIPDALRLSEDSRFLQDEGKIFTALKPGEAQTLEFSGALTAAASGTQDVILITEVPQGETWFVAGNINQSIAVGKAPVSFDLLINETPDLKWARLGSRLAARLSVVNNQDSPLKLNRVALKSKGGLLDWTRVSAEGGVIEGNEIIWKMDGSDTAIIPPGERRDFSAALAILERAARATSPSIEFSAEANYDGSIIQNPPQTLIVVSDLSLTTEARYFNAGGTPVGKGPLPPRAGEETVYEVRIRLRNALHDLSEVTVVAPLPQGSIYQGGATASLGRIEYAQGASEVRWEIPRLPVTTPEASASFQVAVRPVENDKGQLIPLLGVTRVEALDTIAQVRFSADAPLLSSALDSDPFGRGKGVVE